jgi:hypothetical protein
LTVRARRKRIGYLGQERAQPTGVEEVFHQILAGGSDVRDERRPERQLVEAIDRKRHTGSACDGDHVYDGIGGASEREHRGDRIVDARGGDNVPWLEVFPHHVDNPPAGLGRHAAMA